MGDRVASHSRHVLHHLRDLIGRCPDRFATGVYSRMFTIDPDLRELFPAGMSHQRLEFSSLIEHVLDVVPADSGHAELVELLAQLGRDHRKYGVRSAHYTSMYDALVGEMAAMLDGHWDTDTEQVVSQAMMLTTGVMRGAAESAEEPATWTARVVEKYRISRDLAVVRLLTSHPQRFYAGQYLEVQIPQWPRQWRHLSPAIPPGERGELEFHVRAVPGGTVSKSVVTDTQVGDVWTFAQAHGTLTVDPHRDVLMVAGGTGLAPLRSLLLQMARRTDSPRTHLFYGTRYPGELYDLPVLRRIASTNPWLSVTAVTEGLGDPWWLNPISSPRDLGIPHLIGTLADVVSDREWDGYQVLLSGSPTMLEITRRRLLIAGVPGRHIHEDPVQ